MRQQRRLALKLVVVTTNFRVSCHSMRKMSNIDDFDRKLLNLVRRDNLEPARSLADKVGLSISAVLRRLRRLREEQVIIADIAVVNPTLTGSSLTTHVLVRMERPGRRAMDAFANEVARHREVTGAWEVTGDDDFVLKVQVGSMAEYDTFTREVLNEENGVASFKTLITIRTITEDDISRRPLLDM
jgi:Lrp/AsnC family leucine-responsive transcriptional regulator